MSEIESESAEFLQKFGYRSYEGTRNGKFRRILDFIQFEVRSTWDKSTFGKVLLVIVVVTNVFAIIAASSITSQFPGLSPTTAEIRDSLNQGVASYMSFLGGGVLAATEFTVFSLVPQLGFFLILLFGIAGSGLFADDKEGRVVEVYISRINKFEYLISKIGSIMIYTNVFIMIPILTFSILNVQSFGENHFDFIFFYLGIIVFSILISLVYGLIILTLSISVEKRNYASLGFFLIYILASIFGNIIFFSDMDNELLLLIAPENFMALLAFVCLGDHNLGLFGEELLLNDGAGLEYWHVILTALGYIFVLTGYLVYKLRKLTTEEL